MLASVLCRTYSSMLNDLEGVSEEFGQAGALRSTARKCPSTGSVPLLTILT